MLRKVQLAPSGAVLAAISLTSRRVAARFALPCVALWAGACSSTSGGDAGDHVGREAGVDATPPGIDAAPANMDATTADVAAPTDGSNPSAIPPPAFVDTTGQPNALPPYPPGPYGVDVGSVIRNYQLDGYRNPTTSTSMLQPIQLADFYNPHGRDPSYLPPDGGVDDRYFPASSGYPNAGKLKPTALLLDVAAVWCAPCNRDAQTNLPVEYTLYEPCGAEFLLNLVDGPTSGTAATPADLAAWVNKYHVNYAAALDPAKQLVPLFPNQGFPEKVVVDTTTMRIVESYVGISTGTCGQAGFDCLTTSDCAACSPANSVYTCGDGGTSNCCSDAITACVTPAACPVLTCTQSAFWTTFATLLDKTRPGCNL